MVNAHTPVLSEGRAKAIVDVARTSVTHYLAGSLTAEQARDLAEYDLFLVMGISIGHDVETIRLRDAVRELIDDVVVDAQRPAS